MTERIEFGSKAAADRFREEYEDHLCSDDDHRLETVAISSDALDRVLESTPIDVDSANPTPDDSSGSGIDREAVVERSDDSRSRD